MFCLEETRKQYVYFNMNASLADKNGISEEQHDSLLELLRKIANSRTTASFQDAVQALQANEVYTSNTKLQKYLQHYWLSIPEVNYIALS